MFAASCDIKVVVDSPEWIVADLAAAIEGLTLTEEKPFIPTNGAIKRSLNFAWDVKDFAVDRI